MSRKRRSQIIPQDKIVEISEAYADCFSDDRSSAIWQEAFEENFNNCREYNNYVLERRVK